MPSWATGVEHGPYVLVAPIGAGGMGEVWKARDSRLDRVVAVKRLHGQHSERFEQEARAIAALNHPNICQIHDIGPEYLVLEYIDGKPLEGPLPVQEAVRLAIQIASALEEAHCRGILHRDLKPANILVTAKGTAKLLDFGLAKLTTGLEAEVTNTMEGTVLGTAAYMAPEQAQGKPLDERSDIFSFGAVLYEMLSGNRAFGGKSTADIMSAVLRDEPRQLQASAEIVRIVTRCLRKSPADRFQTMAEVKTALENTTAKPAQQQPSVAVLPFANMSADKEQEYFSDGLAEEVINALTHVPGLKVSGRTSSFFFRGKDVEFPEIGRRLTVEYILEGSVRKAGNRIRVTAQLIKACDGFHLWSERYDREMADVFEIQDDIAQKIAAVLQVKLFAGPAAHRHYTPNLPAYEAYLKARYYRSKYTQESLVRSRECYEQSIALDSGFALAYSGLAGYFVYSAGTGNQLPAHEAIPLVRAQAQKALDIDPSLPEAHAILGSVAGIYQYDWKEAERRFRLAMPGDLASHEVRHWYGWSYLLSIGRPWDAADQYERALQEDPLNVEYRFMVALCLQASGRDEDAIRVLKEALELDENSWVALLGLAKSYLSRGMLAEALAFAERAYSLAPWSPAALGLLAGLLVHTGDVSRGGGLLQKLSPGQAYGAPFGFAYFHLICGEIDAAADWIEKAIEQRVILLFFLLRSPVGKALRSSPRWPALLRKLNLPEAVS